jgi:hypothetical protein
MRAATGERVLVIDQSNREVTQACRVSPEGTLSDLVLDNAEFDLVAPLTAEGFRVLHAGEGFDLIERHGLSAARLFAAFGALPEPVDIVLVHLTRAQRLAAIVDRACDCLIVARASDEGIALAYQHIKLASQAGRTLQIVIDGVPTEEAGLRTYRRIAATAERFLGVVPRFAGWLPAESSGVARRVGATATSATDAPASASRRATDEQAERTMAELAPSVVQWRLAEYPYTRQSALAVA